MAGTAAGSDPSLPSWPKPPYLPPPLSLRIPTRGSVPVGEEEGRGRTGSGLRSWCGSELTASSESRPKRWMGSCGTWCHLETSPGFVPWARSSETRNPPSSRAGEQSPPYTGQPRVRGTLGNSQVKVRVSSLLL